jgi:hypothetical protein
VEDENKEKSIVMMELIVQEQIKKMKERKRKKRSIIKNPTKYRSSESSVY